MAISIVVGYDATHANIAHLPKGQACGYTTGSQEIQWTAADWAAHPTAVRICQDSGATDHTADVLDVERYAATYADCPVWAKEAITNYEKIARPGQRKPAIYCSASTVTAVVNALKGGGVAGGIGLWVANWNLTEAQAVADVQTASGPFPIIGIQYTDAPHYYDVDVFDQTWLATVAEPAPPKPHTGQHIATGTESLEAVCARRGVKLEAAIWQTAAHNPHGFGPLEREYFNHGDMTKHMPTGMSFWL